MAALVSPFFDHAGTGDAGQPAWSLAELAETGLLQIDLIPTRFDGPDAARDVAAAFEQIGVQHDRQPYDAILVVGCGLTEPDVGMQHAVLAPCIAKAGIPVLTAVGSDDANTILGDVAQQVFANPASLIAFLATRLSQVPVSAPEAIRHIRSLAGFLLTELEVESRILLDASIRPALRQHLAVQENTLARWRTRVFHVKAHLEQRLARETTLLENVRNFVDQQVEQHTAQRRLRLRRSLLGLRLLAVLAYVALVAALWLITTPQLVIFFSGCLLVLLSAVYTALADRILGQIDAVPVRVGPARERPDHRLAVNDATGPTLPNPAPPPSSEPTSSPSRPAASSRPLTGAPMNDQPNDHLVRAYRDAADENLLLGAILQRLEQSDHLSLDELDAIILQADAAYKARLARLEHTRAMIAGLGRAGEST